MSVTLKDVARCAGVSVTAASFVLNGKKGLHVTEEKARAIEECARSLGYRPNISAQSLRGCERKLIGVLMSMSFGDPALLFCRLLQNKLRERGYVALFLYWSSYNEVSSCYQAVLDHHVDGIIAWENLTPELAGSLPQVLYHASPSLKYDTVSIDNRYMICTAVDKFLEAGRERIAVVASKGSSCHQECREYLQQRGGSKPLHWDVSWSDFQHFLSECKLSLETFPNAIFVHNDILAEVLARYVRRRGWRVPEDVMLIGCNNILELLPEKPLPTFDLQHEWIANTLIELLFRRIAQPDAKTIHKLVRPQYLPSINKAVLNFK